MNWFPGNDLDAAIAGWEIALVFAAAGLFAIGIILKAANRL
jgi:hypothetical protein